MPPKSPTLPVEPPRTCQELPRTSRKSARSSPAPSSTSSEPPQKFPATSTPALQPLTKCPERGRKCVQMDTRPLDVGQFSTQGNRTQPKNAPKFTRSWPQVPQKFPRTYRKDPSQAARVPFHGTTWDCPEPMVHLARHDGKARTNGKAHDADSGKRSILFLQFLNALFEPFKCPAEVVDP